MKPLGFLGSGRDALAAMPAGVRHELGVELMRVQFGGQLTDFNAYRAVYVARFAAAVYVLHALQMKTQRTAQADGELARVRYRMIGGRS